ncbi:MULTISPECIES: bifunctional diaminohydroxyphosphoribosylaminopyrimidine deaminase/5-amino-6-(5-phosphoribosylamino)uracil reductase RibD [Caproicibacterium]|uniref:Riboflavin biosynthesis protein RibD n=1 Tax=Caproicibacterium argilliputei TaxID=3030016 RepID=A0AA97D8H7_9FIRM|nr:bifunctional diaminohydroxyphosphoribosylaminopyrimidine deaminase/5-amino-6-(5-phosphoribosylamino)uracil reductase RibD [Caproicibacterium argilliputei]WOC31617.1 bifunctional diaminohydroxyphosphoribosylaminopyrimidine deaminase/5-amino-6-(5-phosphoribosylamino)uracil reductase RibD [Caproicibacterium argilliputei]
MTDETYMRLALELAQKGCGRVSPNPMVGAVVVKDDRVIGSGYHRQFGGPHAERQALADCRESPRGATLYVTLEPCCHWGKTPPCTDAILESGIARVVVGSGDPNPLVAGRGIRILREHSVAVTEHVLQAACDRLNEVFLHYIQSRTPFVVMKYAMTLDGKIATAAGFSKWITGREARLRVQQDRSRYTAVLAGVGTVLADDPLLTCRLPGGRSPIRVICDTHLRTPLTAQVVRTAKEVRTLLVCGSTAEAHRQPYLEAGCEVLPLPEQAGHVNLCALMQELGRRQIDSVLLEGGAALNWSALQSGIVQKVQAYLAPKLFGGAAAKGPVGGSGVSTVQDAYRLTVSEVTPLGDDLLLESRVIPCLPA